MLPQRISFRGAPEFPVGGAPNALAIADFDGDGRNDVALVDADSERITLLLGQVDSSLAPATETLSTGRGPVAIVSADFDGDGRPDLAVANQDEGSVSTYRGIGAALFATGPAIDVPGQPSALAIYGTELAVADRANARVVLFQTSRGEAFFIDRELPVGESPIALAAADVNGDRILDLVTADADGNSVTALLAGASGFELPMTISLPASPGALSATDLDQDRRLAFAVTLPALDQVAVFRHELSSGRFASMFVTTEVPDPSAVVLADDVGVRVSGDGQPDLLVLSETTNTVSVFKGILPERTKEFTFEIGAQFVTGSVPVALALGQIDDDADGFADVVTTNAGAGTVSLLKGRPAASLTAALSFATGGDEPAAMTGGDFDRDGALDVLVAHVGGTLALVPGNGKGSLREATVVLSRPTPLAVVTGDFDKDGRADIALGSADGTVAAYRSIGKGSFALFRTISLGGPQRVLETGDVDNDGRDDLLAFDGNSEEVVVFSNLPANGAPAFRLASPGVPGGLDTGDLDGDGLTDIVAVAPAIDQILVWHQLSAGGFADAASQAGGPQPSSLVLVDINSDGRLDVVTAHQDDAEVQLRLMTATGALADPDRLAVDGAPVALVTADFNYDGHPDIATVSDVTGAVTVLAGDGSGEFPRRLSISAGARPLALYAGTFTNDVRPDLAVLTAGGNGRVTIFRNTTDVDLPPAAATPTRTPREPSGSQGSGCMLTGGSAPGRGSWLALGAALFAAMAARRIRRRRPSPRRSCPSRRRRSPATNARAPRW